jgi:hypothetical protein
MQKLLLILLSIIVLYGCDGVEDGIVDPGTDAFNVTEINAPTSLSYFGSNTELLTSISFSSADAIVLVWVKVSSQDGSHDITYRKDMTKIGKTEYSIAISMDEEMPSTIYTIDYFIKTEIYNEKKIASHNFKYDNKQNNFVPVILNPLFYLSNSAPNLIDTIKQGKEFILSIEVADSNGLSDLDSVYLNLYNYQDPNNTRITKIELFDDGKAINGDVTEGDGIYSRKNYFPAPAEGKRKFDFYARDRSGAISNIVTHSFVVVK